MHIFGELPTGEKIYRLSICGGGLRASFLNYGTILQDLRLEGHAPSLVLGFDRFEPYLSQSPYFGATAGRCANRIRDGHLEINRKVFQLDRNFLTRHHLHGGAKSMGKRAWEIVGHDSDRVSFRILLNHGEMGYPGNMEATATFRLVPPGTLDIRYDAVTDMPTLCNLAHHSYFNLSGEPDILDHELRVDADRFLPVDRERIPTGELRMVAETEFDFRKARTLRPVCEYSPIDHNFCVSERRQPLREIVSLSSRRSHVTLRCLSTEPGVQIYDGAMINISHPGLDEMRMARHAGMAIEPQIWPDANHHASFPSAILAPGERYRQHTQYVFSKETG